MQQVLTKYLETLYQLFEYDIDVFSQVWIYAWVLIPAVFYLMFFMAKWAVLTAPIWLPLRIIFEGLFKLIYGKKEED